MMAGSSAVAERHSPTVERARQTISAAFPRASAAALAMVSLHVVACVFMVLFLSDKIQGDKRDGTKLHS
jgi:hypothetical protein